MVFKINLWIFFVLCGFFVGPVATAGSVSGPYVVWVNLDKETGSYVDAKIINFANSRIDNCDGEWLKGSSLLYVKTRPPLITDKLVRDVFIRRNRTAMKRLQIALGAYQDEDIGHEGFDGIMVYLKQGGQRILSLSTHGMKIKNFMIDEDKLGTHIEDGFCYSLPPITRKP